MLAVLLLNANRPVQTTQIVDAVWADDPPENGANVVQKYVAGLRRVLEPDRSPRTPGQTLSLTGAGYVLNVPDGGLDADVFDRRVRRARGAWAAGQLTTAGPELQAALALWRGEPLAGLTGRVFEAARERLGDSRAGALEALAEIDIGLGRHAALVPELRRLVAEYPLREQLRYLLMLALYRCGRQAEALAAYREARDFLADEYGVEPGEQLQDLHQQILRSDPGLSMPMSPAPPGSPAPPPLPPYMPHMPYMPYAPGPPSPQLPAAKELPAWARFGAVLVPVFSAGSLTWMLMAAFAVHRRSRVLGVLAAGYLVLAVAGCLLFGADEDAFTLRSDIGMLMLIVVSLGGAVHAAILQVMPRRTRLDPDAVRTVEQRVRRQQARELLWSHPGIARELLIGRPDLPGSFDDGGLVDINGAPVHVLGALPGIPVQTAQIIVADRSLRGEFASVEDLIARGLLPAPVVQELRDTLIVVPLTASRDGGVSAPSARTAGP
ncbi:hypothetical protein Prum_038570 [Phytohabitans rumicis]|uniref:OmpR/PhoB-type domain-containing protein n=1 Tax=Phytohabitans rumicis TaxID=1076125 RepID=A0A6V8LC15_9ACTN|nr:hypothetical protein Prum_038570 [Phytohabitans rumicis]